jgi:hypothetical protein
MEAQQELLKACSTPMTQMGNRRWRLTNLYSCATKDGRLIPFRPNWAQEALLDELHECNLILKARQFGFTTFIQLFMLDACLFNSNIRCGTIAHKLDDGREIFWNKVRLPYDHLPEGKAARPVLRDSADELIFANNSSIRVSTSMRSGTLKYLHITEYGQLCANFPEKAREVRTGALNTVQAGQVVFIESTADGHEGHFYELCEAAQARQRIGGPLTQLDFKFNFFPWWKAPEYKIDPAGVVIDDTFRRYFDTLEESHGISLSPAQRAWYVKKSDTQLEDMKREYPSTPSEAFEASVEGAYYAQQMAKAELQQRIGFFSAEPGYKVNTAWDIGIGDDTAIWCFQIMPGVVRLVGYYANSGEGMPHYLAKLELMGAEKGWTFGTHYMPHDIQVRSWTDGLTRIEQMIREVRKRGLGKHVQKVPNHLVDDGINATRQLLGICQFDAGPTSEGIKALKNYRKDWDGERGVWKDRPRHDSASHGADAFRSLAMSYHDVPIEAEVPDGPYDPVGKLLPPSLRDFKCLTEMNYDELHEAVYPERKRERV